MPTHKFPFASTEMYIIKGFALEFSSLAEILWSGLIELTLYLKVILQKH